MKTDFLKSSFAKIFLIFVAINFVLRVVFSVWECNEINFSVFLIVKIFFTGLFFDFITFCYIATVPMIYYSLIPASIFNHKIHQKVNKILYFMLLSALIFGILAEITFWQEFQTRFNFIAIDYLIYTTEVINNIIQSYPIGWLLAIVFTIAYAIFYNTHKKIVVIKQNNYSKALIYAMFLPFLALVSFLVVDGQKIARISKNNYANEICSNGVYQLFSAFRNNKINYQQLYETIDNQQALKIIRQDIGKNEPQSQFTNKNDIERVIKGSIEKKYNVIFVVLESMSADLMSSFGNKNNLTPNLDNLAKKSLFFTNLKATGTRTVRGLEALSLSVPPTPGNSIIRRPNNENLFNISTPFKDRGYDIRFIYGGDGFFDNMSYFYENNGFESVDRNDFENNEISFENAWGVADEDLYNKTIAKADQSNQAGKPFFSLVMTTSNHRPFTYPENKIDIPSGTNRDGAVKYADYAIGKFLELAKTKSWFDDTIFVFVADHCAGSAGNTDVPLWRYQIPAIFYAPKIIVPQIYNKNVSQIDLAPTLLGFTGFNYKSKFFGSDVIKNYKNFVERSFVSTYLDVGYFKNNHLYLLKPKKEKKAYKVLLQNYGWDGSKEELIADYNQSDMQKAQAYYQIANEFYENDKMKK